MYPVSLYVCMDRGVEVSFDIVTSYKVYKTPFHRCWWLNFLKHFKQSNSIFLSMCIGTYKLTIIIIMLTTLHYAQA